MRRPDQVSRFERDGFVVREGFVAPGAGATLRDRVIVEGCEPTGERAVSTRDARERHSDAEFLDRPHRPDGLPLHRLGTVSRC